MLRRLGLLGLTLVIAFAAGAQSSDPLPFLKPRDIILFQGDSITDGGRWRAGSDFNHIMGQDYAYVLAAEIGATTPQRQLVFLNRGISGDRVPDLLARWQTDTLDLHPQLLSILVGVNDLMGEGPRTVTPEQYEAGYDKLLSQTVAMLPGIRIVLCQPFILPVGKRKESFSVLMPEMKKYQAAVDRLGVKYDLPVVHFQAAFDAAIQLAPPEHWSWDGIHPTYAGHGLMAREWLKTVDAFYGSH